VEAGAKEPRGTKERGTESFALEAILVFSAVFSMLNSPSSDPRRIKLEPQRNENDVATGRKK